jgi:hypothetical protein
MSPVTHFLAGWIVANCCALNRRERAIVAFAGVISDLDGIGLVAEGVTRGWEHPLTWYSDYHHVLGHNLGVAIMVTTIGSILAARRCATGLLTLLSFHLHLLCDLAGSRGPDGYQWPIHYLLPFSDSYRLTWAGQWELDAWPNVVITLMLVALTLFLAWSRGFSPVELFSSSGDRAVIASLRRRFAKAK